MYYFHDRFSVARFTAFEHGVEHSIDALLQYWLKWINTGCMVRAIAKNTAVDAGGLGFNSQAGQIEHSVASGSPPLRRLFEAICCPSSMPRG